MSATIEEPRPADPEDNGHSHCLLCGRRNPWSLNLDFQAAADGGVSSRIATHAALQGYDGILHGGVIAALLDAAMTHCLFHHGVQALTGDLHVRYVRPVSCGVGLDLRARVLEFGPPLYRVRAEVLHDRKIMAWAEAKFVRRRGLK